MPNYPDHPDNQDIVYLTADDLIQSGLDGEIIELERSAERIALTADAGELLNELSEHQRERHTGAWD